MIKNWSILETKNIFKNVALTNTVDFYLHIWCIDKYN
jgi:hypothetical protein